jgi:ribose transport system substrate-binding protein
LASAKKNNALISKMLLKNTMCFQEEGMKRIAVIALILATVFSIALGFAGGKRDAGKSSGIKIGYISPGSDTWYLRAEEGAKWACQKAGAQFIAVNSNRDYEKEQANIDYLINEGVNCIVTLSWNEAGSVSTAEKCAKAGIGCVVFDACGIMFNHNVNFTASVDFDWAGMGTIYADWMKAKYPGQNYVYIDGLLDSVVCQTVTTALKKATDAGGSNKQVDKRIGEYNPEVAANQAEDLVNSGLDFSIIGVINEDCAAAIITRLEDMGVANKYHVFAENGSDTGIALLKAGKLEFTISSSPGLEAAVAVFAGIDYAINGGQTKRKIDCPIASANTSNVSDPYAVIPWKVDETVWTNIIKQSFPQYAYFFK